MSGRKIPQSASFAPAPNTSAQKTYLTPPSTSAANYTLLCHIQQGCQGPQAPDRGLKATHLLLSFIPHGLQDSRVVRGLEGNPSSLIRLQDSRVVRGCRPLTGVWGCPPISFFPSPPQAASKARG